MMYSEFIEGTGCKENAHNYKVFKDLEIMYMNSDLTKEDIYEYGKKLVDNSKSPEELKVEGELKIKLAETIERINEVKKEISDLTRRIETECDPEWIRTFRGQRNRMRQILDDLVSKRKEINWILNS